MNSGGGPAELVTRRSDEHEMRPGRPVYSQETKRRIGDGLTTTFVTFTLFLISPLSRVTYQESNLVSDNNAY